MRPNRRPSSLALVSIVIAALGCSGDDANGPNPDVPPAAITILSGDRQVGEVGAPLAQPIAVTVRDESGRPLQGVALTFSVTGGGGSVAEPTDTTDAQGVASTIWTMGYVVNGQQPSVVARPTSPNVDPVTFTAVATLTAGTLVVIRGDSQVGVVRAQLPKRPTVRVTTPGPAGVPVQGVVVVWSVTAGGGTVDTTSTTDAAGTASSRWTLGDSTGDHSQVLHATVPSLGGAYLSFDAGAFSPPASIATIAGDLQAGTASEPLAQSLVVEVRNTLGKPQAGVVVHWEALDVCDGWCEVAITGRVSSDTTVTDSLGRAEVGFVLPWMAGYSGIVLARVGSVVGYFTATVLPGPPISVISVYGDSQAAPAGSRLPQPISVYVSDQFWNPIAGVTVEWAAAPESGSTEVSTSVTDNWGRASTSWTIGTTVGTNNQVATATVAGLIGSPVTFTASATAGP